MTSVYYTSNPLEWRLTDAVIIDEQDQPTAPKLSGAPRVAHVIGAFPWGPVNEVVRIGSGKELVDTFFGRTPKAIDYAGYRTLVGKEWGPLEIVRIANETDKKATVEIKNSQNDAVITLEAKCPGECGNELQVRLTNVVGFLATLEIRWGNSVESARIEINKEVPSFDSKWVTATKIGGAADITQSDNTWHALTGGTTGVISDADWVGTESNPKGVNVAKMGSDGGVWLGADHTGAAWVKALQSVVKEKRAVGCVQAEGTTIKQNITFASQVADDRILFFGSRVNQYIDGKLVETDVASFGASVLVKTSPNLSIAEDRWSQYLASIVSIAHNQELYRENWINADQAGLNLLERRDTGGYRFHMGITSDPDKPLIVRRRMTDFVNENVASALAPWRNRVPIPEHKTGAKLAMNGRLSLMMGTDAAPDSKMIRAFEITESNADATSVEYKVRVQLFGEMRFIIAHVKVGENVIIEEE